MNRKLAIKIKNLFGGEPDHNTLISLEIRKVRRNIVEQLNELVARGLLQEIAANGIEEVVIMDDYFAEREYAEDDIIMEKRDALITAYRDFINYIENLSHESLNDYVVWEED